MNKDLRLLMKGIDNTLCIGFSMYAFDHGYTTTGWMLVIFMIFNVLSEVLAALIGSD